MIRLAFFSIKFRLQNISNEQNIYVSIRKYIKDIQFIPLNE
jgi:hypothetical protein